MKIYAAPMEGITGYIYRNAHHDVYGGIDRYYTPFLTPKKKRGYTARERNDILPEHNRGIPVVPQILTSSSQDFLMLAEKLEAMGYPEVNLNLGCPSGTVTAKGKGSGFLEDPEALLRFFEDIFPKIKIAVSVKTRLGMHSYDEALPLMDVFNQFPFAEVIIHARVRDDYYRNPVNRDVFRECMAVSRNPVCYNGDITDKECYEKLCDENPDLEQIMVGRGLIANPQLAEQLCGKTDCFDAERFTVFHEKLVSGYEEIMSGERDVLFKMKELWSYMMDLFPGQKRSGKKIKKAGSLRDYRNAVEELLADRM